MTKLSVNLNKVALIRNSRGSNFPRLTDFASICINAGAHGLTIHPRPDQRHAKYDDVYDLVELVRDHPEVEVNIEGNPDEKFLQVVLEARPAQCTLVPDDPGQLTSDHGWDTIKYKDRLTGLVSQLHGQGIRSSVFLDPDTSMLEAAVETKTDRIELYTESYAKAFGTEREAEVLAQYAEVAKAAGELGLGLNAGHDLNQDNLGRFLSIPGILEVSIGHALTVEALQAGFEKTIIAYLEIVKAKH